jgi:hypothetical protein
VDAASVADPEALVHYIKESSKFAADGVNHRLFLLPKNGTNKSVFRVDGLSIAEVLALGVEHVGKAAEKPIYGWARLIARDVRSLSLSVRPDEPPPRHALIEGWPTGWEDQRVLAMAIAAKAISFRLPSPVQPTP